MLSITDALKIPLVSFLILFLSTSKEVTDVPPIFSLNPMFNYESIK